jgi:hypothetical protein
LALQKRQFLAFLGMQARRGEMHLESLALGAVQAIKRRSPAPRGPGWPRNANQMHPKTSLTEASLFRAKETSLGKEMAITEAGHLSSQKQA